MLVHASALRAHSNSCASSCEALTVSRPRYTAALPSCTASWARPPKELRLCSRWGRSTALTSHALGRDGGGLRATAPGCMDADSVACASTCQGLMAVKAGAQSSERDALRQWDAHVHIQLACLQALAGNVAGAVEAASAGAAAAAAAGLMQDATVMRLQVMQLHVQSGDAAAVRHSRGDVERAIADVVAAAAPHTAGDAGVERATRVASTFVPYAKLHLRTLWVGASMCGGACTCGGACSCGGACTRCGACTSGGACTCGGACSCGGACTRCGACTSGGACTCGGACS
eukprot:364910-Chlamydomonas_euryale.AAC.7